MKTSTTQARKALGRQRGHAARAWNRTAVLAVVSVLFTLLLTPVSAPLIAAAAPGDAFDPAVPRVFVAQGVPTRLYSAVQGNGSIALQPEGVAAAIGYNAVGYNTVDNYLYGIRRDDGFRTVLVRVGQGGVVTSLGAVTALPAPATGDIYNQGTFGSGATANILYVRNSQIPTSTQMWAINVATRAATQITLSTAVPNLSDLVWKDGFLWGLNVDNVMYRINPATGQVSSWATGLGFNGTFGAQWLYGNGNLGMSENVSGTVYQVAVANPASATPTFTRVSATTGPATDNNDGASTPGVDVDMAITKAGPAYYSPGSAISYSMTVANNGPGTSSGSQVTDTIPAGITAATTPTPGCTIVSGVLRCALAGLAVGATQTISVSGTVTSATTGALTNVARVTGNERDPNPANDQSSTTAQTRPTACVGVPVWVNTASSLVQYDSSSFQVLSSVALGREYGDIAWSSNGSVLYGVDYDAGTGIPPVLRTIDPATGTAVSAVNITGPILTQTTVPGPSATLYSLNALAAIDANTLLVGSYSSRMIFRLDVRTGVSTLWTQFPTQISSAGDFTVLPDGDILAFGVRPLDGNLSNSRVYRIHPDGSLTQIGTVPAMWGGAQSGGSFYMAAPAGQINKITLATLPTAASTAPLSYTTVLSGGPQFWGASAVQDAGECVGLTITKTPTPTIVTTPGQQITYSFVVTNISDVRIEAITVTDLQQPPAGPLTTTPTCPQTALNPTQSMTCTATYLATETDLTHGRIDDTATAAGTTPDGRHVTSNQATATVLAHPTLTWTLTKHASLNGTELPPHATIHPGDEITYTVTATSTATIPITGVTLTDNLTDVLDNALYIPGSAHLTIGATTPTPVPDPTGTTLTAGPFTLPAGTTATLTYRTTVAPDAWTATLTNTVTATAGTPTNPINPQPCDTHCTTTQHTPTPIQIQKVGEDTTGTIVPMNGSTWTIWTTPTGGTPLTTPTPATTTTGTPITGLFRDTTLTPGTYWLEETHALNGFTLLAQRVPFTITPNGTLTLDPTTPTNIQLTTINNTPTIRIQDHPALDLPNAGGPSTTPLHTTGILLILTATTTLLITHHRRRHRGSEGGAAELS